MSSNLLTEFIAPGVTRTEDAYEGNYAVQLNTGHLFGLATPAKLVLGKTRVDYISNTLDSDGAGLPVEGNLDKLRGYYKYASAGQGQGSLMVQITRFDDGEHLLVFDREYLFSPVQDYTPFEISFESYSFEEGKDTLLLAFNSSASEASSLLVDALNIAYLTSTEEKIGVEGNQLLVSPVPASASQELHITLDGKRGGNIEAVSLLSMGGVPLYHSKPNSSSFSLPTLHLPPGLYFVVVEMVSGEVLAKKAVVLPR
ncbi:MAG: hypothetical protein KDD28_19200 [Phaeodactylibacter sp.]|nr:hypothetical protein [Phaeodactylibacter sp.]